MPKSGIQIHKVPKLRIVEMTVAQCPDKLIRRLYDATDIQYVVEELVTTGFFKRREYWRYVNCFTHLESAEDCILRIKGLHPEQIAAEEALHYPKQVIWEDE